ncbi:DNA polymerase ligase N-terminal domain-containing protein [Actinomadura madurae]|uniref:DNA polymerase ligase N-terminal domain-containing protein n=1 Tax=Actinomadura madurae TaxID=1993 RepID=UPI0020D25557|nr:DNA polymerase ligase N-terminal domain-containing protein [Actinomadura madurae]MCP9954756.1 ATP-dependent DNA ligase [Actinomadura madurae]MCP9983992.1 ATP-dependent DNA ligase [Actinomadura madurae]MCQ0004445.1 ATP-dependent DNA ligase [Actinomadura madurae]
MSPKKPKKPPAPPAPEGDRLAEYRGRRDAGRTPEPVPEENALPHGDDDTFVVQEHHATSLHWDLRLERDGVLVSWAVPKGLPWSPDTNHLAVHTEDHPLEYASFEGEIPRGEYGAGKMIIWDRGTYETEKWSEREVKVVIHGSRVSGRYVLFKTRGRNWMIHRMDPPADPDAEPLPESLRPMRPVERARLPRDQEAWGFEFAWGGRRLLAYVEGGRTRFTDERGRAVDGPGGLGSRLGAELGARPAVLDGERAVLDGRETYMIYDLPHLDGRPLLDVPYRERRERLDGLGLSGRLWQTAPWFPGDGHAVRDAARGQGLPGVVAKRLDSPTRPARSRTPGVSSRRS